MKTCCVVVIGHVDHGKTTLVHAITGIATDRLPEEKARGLSILPGYAHRLYDGGMVDFIDAPGHEDFIPAMVGGASGADAALIVVSASEGIGAQTFEHLEIAALLGLQRGVIAVTKMDLLDPSIGSARLDELRAALSQTPFGSAPMIQCSALSGDGLDDLNAAIEALLVEPSGEQRPQEMMLPIDRVFSLKGQGTIVTGTLLGGNITTGAEAVIQPIGHSVTVRGLHSRGDVRKTAHVAERVAVNLRGVSISEVARGAVLCANGFGAPTECFDVEVELLSSVDQPLKHMQEVRVLFGTSSEVAQVRLFGAGRIEPGQKGFAQLRFKQPVFGYSGQRAVLRQLSPSDTIGGAQILDPQATPARGGDKMRTGLLQAVTDRNPERIATALTHAGRGVASLQDIARLSRRPEGVDLGSEFVTIDQTHTALNPHLETNKERIVAALTSYHKMYPLKLLAPHAVIQSAGVSPLVQAHVEAQLCENGILRMSGNKVALIGHDPEATLTSGQRQQLASIEETYRQSALASTQPPTDQFSSDLMGFLADTGRLIALPNVALKQTIVFHAEALCNAERNLRAAFPAPTGFTTSQARAALGTSRKIIVPVLEYFDSTGATLRVDDRRQFVDAI